MLEEEKVCGRSHVLGLCVFGVQLSVSGVSKVIEICVISAI